MGAKTADERNAALRAIAAAVRASTPAILEANRQDLAAGEARGLSAAMLDRLALSESRLDAMASAVEAIASAPEVLGAVAETTTRPNGLVVERVRIPLGVIAMIYESRPNVTTDAAALCLKAGNAVILRGGSEAAHSNQALGTAVAKGLMAAGLPEDAVVMVPAQERETIRELLACEEDIDLVIPRGGEGLIRFVTANSKIPVIQHYKGVCHVYVHASADQDLALAICENGKVQRPGVCNAVETILVDSAAAAAFIPRLVARFAACGVEIRGCPRTRELAGDAIVPATEDDWHAEYLALICAVRVVDGLEQAVDHIETYGSNHTEAILATDESAIERFLAAVDSSTVVINASTRFADGGELGLGAEIGISTTKLHAYGPMGAEGLTTLRFVVRGKGQVRS